ncbi:hypothetical protein DL95DRAFT_496314 [Leptodontidium sp. 2 PMI_412]|nr:hypothetical protein DL95DRAFT_496314 [Leptodontidium sp. 2 PMI_412]
MSVKKFAINNLEREEAIPEFSALRIAVFGGLALWRYLPNYRTTNDVDFIINLDSAPGGVKSKLLSLHNSPFVEHAQFFYYKSPNGQLIQSPYLPPTSRVLSGIPNGVVPYISATDLLVFKINSCGLRAEPAKALRDASDAEALLNLELRSGPLILTPDQKVPVKAGLVDIAKHTNRTEGWWKERLGL